MKSFFPITMFVFISYLAIAQAYQRQYVFDHFHVGNGLSHHLLYDIVQDKEGYIWIASQNGLQRFDGQKFTSFYHDPRDSTSLSRNTIGSLLIDNKNNLIIGFGANPEVDQFDPKTETFIHKDDAQFRSYAKQLFLDRDYKNRTDDQGNLWQPCKPDIIISGTPFKISQTLENKNGMFWYATTYGLFTKSKSDQCLTPFQLTDQSETPIDGKLIMTLAFDPDGRLWLSSHPDEIYIIDLESNKFEFIPTSQFGLAGIRKIIFDDTGSVWMMSQTNGLVVLHQQTKQFEWFTEENKTDPSISYVFEDSQSHMWYLNEEIQTENPSIRTETLNRIGSCYSMDESENDILWFGTTNSGIRRLDVKEETIQKFFYEPFSEEKENYQNAVTAQYLDKKGNLWVGFWGGAVGRLNINDFTDIELYPCYYKDPESDLGCFIQSIQEIKDGRLLFGSSDVGFSIFNPLNQEWKSFKPSKTNTNGLQHEYVRSIIEDRTGMVWLGTYGGGLYRFDPKTEEFKHYGRSDGLPDEIIESLVEDQQGNIWIVSTKHITRFNPSAETFDSFGEEDGLPNTQFHDLTYASESSGKMHLSTAQGFVSFHPDSILTDSLAPNTVIQQMVRYRSEGGNMSSLKVKGVNDRKSVDIDHLDEIVTFDISSIKFHKASDTKMEFKLEGYQDEWIQLGDTRQVSFTNLPAGTYTLLARSANGDGIWDKTPATLDVIVHPPWWKTWWAYCIYILSGLCIVYFFWQRETRRLKLKSQLEREQLEAAQLRKLDETKTRFFANVSHEFRTPLTVILGMAEEIEQPSSAKAMIKRSSQHLLRLINQMLDITKMDDGKLKLETSIGDLVQYMQYLMESYQSLAAYKDIQLTFKSSLERLVMDYDEDKIQHIISNLLSNAIKFTPAGGKIILELLLDDPTSHSLPVSIKLADNGIGISDDQTEKVFERFYQVPNSMQHNAQGTGIGLAFTKELVELMEGTIAVESIVDIGTAFTVRLPYRIPTNQVALDKLGPSNSTETIVSETTKREIISKDLEESLYPSLLLVEDNPEVVNYISSILQDTYDISVAQNGRIGIEKAIEFIPDIIISDVMMPEKDGFEVTKTLKSDERTSHIPIILLTAKADAESRLEGIHRGADAYLSKPFNKQELLLWLSKLIELRQKLQTRYVGFAPVEESTETDVLIEDVFLKKINDIIEGQLANASFGVTDISRDIGLSQSQLFRKLKALTGKSTVAYLRSFRLHRAKSLLENREMNVSEVAYAVGYNDPLYFSRLFSKEFGAPPKEFTVKS